MQGKLFFATIFVLYPAFENDCMKLGMDGSRL
jgi:hypothetical protein